MSTIAEHQLGVNVPKVLTKAGNDRDKAPPPSFRTIFWTLLSHFGDEPFELDAVSLSEATNYSQKTIYKAIRFLLGTRLLERIERGRGRGHHSVYRVRWKQRDHPTTSGDGKNLTSTPIKSKRLKHRSSEATLGTERDWQHDRRLRVRYLTSGWTTLQKGRYGFKRAAKLFRLSCLDVGMPHETAESITGMLLHQLEGMTASTIALLHDDLFFHIWQRTGKLFRLLRKGITAVCRWINWILGWMLPDVVERIEQVSNSERELDQEWKDEQLELEELENRIQAAGRANRLQHAIQRFLYWIAAMEGLYGEAFRGTAQCRKTWEELCTQYQL